MCEEKKMIKCNYSKEMRIGAKIELEHTKSKRLARKIASDHLAEFKCYYSRGLLPMERKLKRLQGGNK